MTGPQPSTVLGCAAVLTALTADGAIVWWALRPLDTTPSTVIIPVGIVAAVTVAILTIAAALARTPDR